MQRKPFMQKKHSRSQRHWNRMSKVLPVLTTYGKGTVPATGWESVFIKFVTAERLNVSNYWDFYKVLESFWINQWLACLQKTFRILKKIKIVERFIKITNTTYYKGTMQHYSSELYILKSWYMMQVSHTRII